MPVKVGSALWNRVFGGAQLAEAEESKESSERIAGIKDLVSRPSFRTEIVLWLEVQAKAARVVPGPEKDMVYRCGLRDGIELVLDRMKSLQDAAKERYDES